MANTNSPFGFKPLGIFGAAQPTMQLDTAKASAASLPANGLFRGDPICRSAGATPPAGYVTNYPIGGYGGTAGVSSLVGVFWGAKYFSTAFGRTVVQQFLPTTDVASDATIYYIPCNSFPNPLFAAQATLAPITFASIGMNVDVVPATGAVKGAYGISAYTLNSTPVTGATLPFRIVGLLSDYFPAGTPGTDNGSNYNVVVVSANTAQATGV